MLKKTLKYFINKFLSLFNLQLNRITLSKNFYFYIVKTLNRFKIDTVIDIGANEGQFAQNIIKYGYKKEIISFEPIKSIHKILLSNASDHSNWTVEDNIGFGKFVETKEINITKNKVSSSILKIDKRIIEIEPGTEQVKKEKIRLITLDKYLNQKYFKNKKIFIKIDTQGYEENIIKGSKKKIKNISGFMLETSIKPLHNKEKDYSHIIKLMKKMGFSVWAMARGFSDKKTGQVLQVDIIFINDNEK